MTGMIVLSLIIMVTGEKIPANVYLFKVNNRNPRKRCELCSKLKKKKIEFDTFFCIVTEVPG